MMWTRLKFTHNKRWEIQKLEAKRPQVNSHPSQGPMIYVETLYLVPSTTALQHSTRAVYNYLVKLPGWFKAMVRSHSCHCHFFVNKSFIYIIFDTNDLSKERMGLSYNAGHILWGCIIDSPDPGPVVTRSKITTRHSRIVTTVIKDLYLSPM